MFWLIAIIRPFKLNAVYDALIDENVGGMTITEVKGFGNQKSDPEVYRGNQYTNLFLPKIKIEMAVSEEKLEPIIEAIVKVSKTGKPGDGKIFIFKMEDALRIRTGEVNIDAII